jgi:hypothetical protein
MLSGTERQSAKTALLYPFGQAHFVLSCGSDEHDQDIFHRMKITKKEISLSRLQVRCRGRATNRHDGHPKPQLKEKRHERQGCREALYMTRSLRPV